MLKDISNINSKSNLKSGDLFSSINDDFDPYEKYKNIQELTLSEKLHLEKKSLGYYFSGHPVLAIENKILKIRSKKINELTAEIKKASLICLINSVRQIKDRSGKPLTFISFDDGSGVMDGIIASDVLETSHSVLKEGEILCLKGNVEVDDYRTNDLGSLMFRMRVKEISSLDSELINKIEEVIIDANRSEAISLNDISDRLLSIDKDFWLNGSCKLNVKVMSNSSEAIIDLGDDFKFNPTLENLFFIEDIFGKNILET